MLLFICAIIFILISMFLICFSDLFVLAFSFFKIHYFHITIFHYSNLIDTSFQESPSRH
ncbi:unnamed protein product [Meloidogyne enterolobii]|uniref:Uncharacterized protein n=1 Tax=Meloidogyne enterolobii TaxID=390850 RepID=A0ACB1A196_MELEN